MTTEEKPIFLDNGNWKPDPVLPGDDVFHWYKEPYTLEEIIRIKRAYRKLNLEIPDLTGKGKSKIEL